MEGWYVAKIKPQKEACLTHNDQIVGRILSDDHYLIVMSEGMPPVDDLDLLPTLRGLTKSPIVVLGSGDEADMVHGHKQLTFTKLVPFGDQV